MKINIIQVEILYEILNKVLIKQLSESIFALKYKLPSNEFKFVI